MGRVGWGMGNGIGVTRTSTIGVHIYLRVRLTVIHSSIHLSPSLAQDLHTSGFFCVATSAMAASAGGAPPPSPLRPDMVRVRFVAYLALFLYHDLSSAFASSLGFLFVSFCPTPCLAKKDMCSTRVQKGTRTNEERVKKKEKEKERLVLAFMLEDDDDGSFLCIFSCKVDKEEVKEKGKVQHMNDRTVDKNEEEEKGKVHMNEERGEEGERKRKMCPRFHVRG